MKSRFVLVAALVAGLTGCRTTEESFPVTCAVYESDAMASVAEGSITCFDAVCAGVLLALIVVPLAIDVTVLTAKATYDLFR